MGERATLGASNIHRDLLPSAAHRATRCLLMAGGGYWRTLRRSVAPGSSTEGMSPAANLSLEA